MRYYKLIENNTLVAIGTGPGGTEITEAEYNELLTMIREQVSLEDKLYLGEITIDDVPVEWQKEIQSRVDERKALEEANEEEAEATEEDYINALAELGRVYTETDEPVEQEATTIVA